MNRRTAPEKTSLDNNDTDIPTADNGGKRDTVTATPGSVFCDS